MLDSNSQQPAEDRLGEEDQRYLRAELLAVHVRTLPAVVIEVVKRLASLQTAYRISEEMHDRRGLSYDTARSIEEKWRDGKLRFLDDYVLPTRSALKSDDEVRAWLVENRLDALSAIGSYSEALRSFADRPGSAGVPDVMPDEPKCRMIIESIRLQSPVLKSLQRQWRLQAEKCSKLSIRLKQGLIASVTQGVPPENIEIWTEALLVAAMTPSLAPTFAREKDEQSRFNLRWGAWLLVVGANAKEAEESKARFERLLSVARREGRILLKEQAILLNLTEQMERLLYSWVQP